MYEMKTAIGVF